MHEGRRKKNHTTSNYIYYFFSFIRVLFEKIIPERTQVDAEQFMKSGSYLYLRSGSIERWNVLAKLHTYPNMIKPLNIS